MRRLPSPDSSGVSHGHLGNRVLLVDDDRFARKLISGYLLPAGYVVETAEDGLDAIGKLRAGLPDLIICDLNMPRMDGFEFLDIVRKRFPHIPVIVISGFDADELPVGVANDAYCAKNALLAEQLLKTIPELTRNPPLRTAPPPVDDKPVQVRWDGSGRYIIGCRDCLREFSAPRVFQMRPDETWTTCVHCGKLVHFLVAEDLEGT